MEIIFGRGIGLASSLGASRILVTKNLLESTCFMRCTDSKRWRFKFCGGQPYHRNLSSNYVPFFNRINAHEIPLKCKFNKNILVTRYCHSKTSSDAAKDGIAEFPKNGTIFAKMKYMTKEYWRVVIPVHILTSIAWVAVFYITVKNGVDFVKILEFFNLSEKYLEKVRNSGAGTWALTYLLYKIVTPLRYTVTIAGSTMAIKKLSKMGLVKPLPFGKHPQVMYKKAETAKATAGAHNPQFKVEKKTQPPKT